MNILLARCESEVEIVAPDADDALSHPEALLDMAVSVRDYHHHASDAEAWADLIRRIRVAGDKLDGVEIETVV